MIAEFYMRQKTRVLACNQDDYNDLRTVRWAHSVCSFYFATEMDDHGKLLWKKFNELFNSVEESAEKRSSDFYKLYDVENVVVIYCEYCKQEGAIFKCSRCSNARYCSKVCQRSAWKSHKPNCVAPATL